MSHLKLEALARLVDEAPKTAEAEHLERCAACRGRYEELMEQTAALAGLPAIQPPDGAWESLKDRLEAEGLLQPAEPKDSADNGAGARRNAYDRSWKWPSFARVAAAAALFVLGGLTGYAVAGPGGGMAAGGEISAAEGDEQLAATTEEREGQPDSGEWDLGSLDGTPGSTHALPEATSALREAEAVYFAAMKNYTVASGSTDSPDPLTRLAALQSIVLTTRAALDDAPADPVINGYHLTALAQRDGILESFAMSDEEEVWF